MRYAILFDADTSLFGVMDGKALMASSRGWRNAKLIVDALNANGTGGDNEARDAAGISDQSQPTVIKDAVAAPAGWRSIPPGYALVPVEPTEVQLVAGATAAKLRNLIWDAILAGKVYSAMLAAAPSAPAPGPDLGSSSSVASSGVGPECPTAVADPAKPWHVHTTCLYDEGPYQVPCKLCGWPNSPANWILLPFNVVMFLLGSGALEGVYFGEKHPTKRGRYWWRHSITPHLAPDPARHLVNDDHSPAADATAVQPKQLGAERQSEVAEQLQRRLDNANAQYGHPDWSLNEYVECVAKIARDAIAALRGGRTTAPTVGGVHGSVEGAASVSSKTAAPHLASDRGGGS